MSAFDKPFTVACHTGRLVELRVVGFSQREQFAQAQSELAEVLDKVREPILCVDVRGGRLMPEEFAEASLDAMRIDNPLFVRCAMLVASPMLALQMTRLSREANNVRRRIFDNPHQLELWLRPHLSGPEFARLQAFLSEGPALRSDVETGTRPAKPSGH